MVMKLLYLLATFLLAETAMGQNDVAFRRHFNLNSAAVAQNVRKLNRITASGRISSFVGGKIVALHKPSICKPISVIVRTPDTYYNPVPTRKTCSGSCPHGQTCTPFKTVTQNFKVLVFRQFNCWGVFIWLPIGTTNLCITDEFNCQCKPRCKPLNCFPPRFFNETSCDCECPDKKCKRPFALDPSSCQCRCPKNFVCPRPRILNFRTCKCVCPNMCKAPFIENTKTCRCICPKRCPRGAYLDRRKCECVGDCKRFRTASDCNRVDSCSDNRARKCRYFSSSSHKSCQCECCVKKNLRSSFNCGKYSSFGQFRCQSYFDRRIRTTPCKWACA